MLSYRKDLGRGLNREDEPKLTEAIRRNRSPVLFPIFGVMLDSGPRASEIRCHDRRNGSQKEFARTAVAEANTHRCQGVRP